MCYFEEQTKEKPPRKCGQRAVARFIKNALHAAHRLDVPVVFGRYFDWLFVHEIFWRRLSNRAGKPGKKHL